MKWLFESKSSSKMDFFTKTVSCNHTIENSHVNLKGTITIILLDKTGFILIFKLNCYKKSWSGQQPVEYEYWMESDSFINIETEITSKSLGQGLMLTGLLAIPAD
jgi:hypothetical protein